MGTRWRQIPQKTNHFGQGSRAPREATPAEEPRPTVLPNPTQEPLGLLWPLGQEAQGGGGAQGMTPEQPKAEEQSCQNQVVLLLPSQVTGNIPLGPAPPLLAV